MKSASFSIKFFGIYLIITGLSMAFAPNQVLEISGFPRTEEPWVQVLGSLASVLGYYYWSCGVAGATAFYKATIIGRIAGFFILSALVVKGSPTQLLTFGIADLAGAFWTYIALRQNNK